PTFFKDVAWVPVAAAPGGLPGAGLEEDVEEGCRVQDGSRNNSSAGPSNAWKERPLDVQVFLVIRRSRLRSLVKGGIRLPPSSFYRRAAPSGGQVAAPRVRTTAARLAWAAIRTFSRSTRSGSSVSRW